MRFCDQGGDEIGEATQAPPLEFEPPAADALQPILDDLAAAISHAQTVITKVKAARAKVQALLGD